MRLLVTIFFVILNISLFINFVYVVTLHDLLTMSCDDLNFCPLLRSNIVTVSFEKGVT